MNTKQTKHSPGPWQVKGGCIKAEGWKIIASMGSADNASDETVAANA